MGKWEKLRTDGVATLVRRRLRGYEARLKIDNPVVGRLVELLGDRVRMDGMTYSVASPNITRGHKSTLAFGLHEIEERALIRRWLPSDLPAIELGGGLGVVSCLVNRRLADPAAHVVVEANPYMVPVLEANRDRNRCRFQVLNAAIAHGAATVRLPIDPEFVGSSLARGDDARETVEVAARTLADVAEHAGFDSFSLVADIEGAEADVILKDLPALGPRVRFAMMEMHPYALGDARVAELMARMTALGFSLKERLGDGPVFSVAFAR